MNLNPTKAVSLPLLFCALALPAGATSYYFNAANIADTAIDLNDASVWYLDAGFTIQATEAPNFTDGTADLYFSGASPTSGSPKLSFGGDIYVNSITWEAGGSANLNYAPVLTSSEGATIRIKGDLKNNTKYDGYIGGGNNNAIIVEGDLYLASTIGSADSRIGSVKSIVVNGVTTVGHTGQNYGKIYATGESSIDNPNILFKSHIVGNTPREGSDTETLQYGSFNDMQVDNDSHMWVNGFSGTAGVAIRSNVESTGSLTVVLTNNSQSQYSTGSIGYMFNYTGTSGAKLGFVVRSAAYGDDLNITRYLSYGQSFSGGTMKFEGGVRMQSGFLYLNYAADGANMNHGTLSLKKHSEAEIARFGNSNVQVGGTFAFDSLEVSGDGGTIRVRLDVDENNAAICDKLSFEKGATGSGQVTIELADALGNLPDDYWTYLIRENKEDGLQVMSWTEGAADTISFVTNSYCEEYELDGVIYRFAAYDDANGLYVSYIAVPEPAEWAAIFALAALAAAARRRRR